MEAFMNNLGFFALGALAGGLCALLFVNWGFISTFDPSKETEHDRKAARIPDQIR